MWSWIFSGFCNVKNFWYNALTLLFFSLSFSTEKIKTLGNHGFSSESLDPRSCFWTCAFMPTKRWYPQALNLFRSYVHINIMRLFFFLFFFLCSALTMILRVGFIRTVSKQIELESPGGSGLEEDLKASQPEQPGLCSLILFLKLLCILMDIITECFLLP